GKSRGFNEDHGDATKAGYVGEGYGERQRRETLQEAYRLGLNFLDVTIDPEQEALGRNLQDDPPAHAVYVHTRPQGMGYGYGPYNARMAQYDELRAEVERILRLLQRDTIDVLNVPFLQPALDHDPDYLDKIGENVARLKERGLIRCAGCDTFSSEATYLRQIESGHFDSIAINLNFADEGAVDYVLPAAAERGMGVVTREAFLKGGLFRMGDEAGIVDWDALARAALKWNLSHLPVTSVLVGAKDVAQLRNAASVLDDPALSDEDERLLDQLRETDTYRSTKASKDERFVSSR
ncbi:aldo/keto reductase, partial [Candidatus Poribacteria bacterium]|nr:aldo/keto reductase [Candidatus Poribacteria bacterium]